VREDLPDLRSDAEVDALMARLRTKIGPAPAPMPLTESVVKQAASDDAIRDLVAAQDGFASTVVRAMRVIAETLEEFEADAPDAAAAPARARRGRAHPPPLARRRKGARRKAR
jgi:hypothetical protein